MPWNYKHKRTSYQSGSVSRLVRTELYSNDFTLRMEKHDTDCKKSTVIREITRRILYQTPVKRLDRKKANLRCQTVATNVMLCLKKRASADCVTFLNVGMMCNCTSANDEMFRRVTRNDHQISYNR